MSIARSKTARLILALGVAAALAGPALGASPDTAQVMAPPAPAGLPDASCSLGGPGCPEGGGEAAPLGGMLPGSECYEVLHGDWVCVEYWVFGCLQSHCVYPGTECSLYVPIPCPGEGPGGSGNDQKLQPRS
jgi:hypothetical protein